MERNINVQLNPSWPMFLTALFLVLRLTGVTHWDWLWVFAPLWIGAALIVFVLVGVALFARSVFKRFF